jgi:hypothetical protein
MRKTDGAHLSDRQVVVLAELLGNAQRGFSVSLQEFNKVIASNEIRYLMTLRHGIKPQKTAFHTGALASRPGAGTNQQLLDESIVLVNGVRIALNLQLVE